MTDSKSVGSDTVWVRVPPPAPRRSKLCIACSDLFYKSERAHAAAPPSQLRPAALGSQLAGCPFAACFVDRAERLHGPLQPAANVDPRGRSVGRKLPCDGGAPHQKSPCARSAQGLSAIKELLPQGVACGGNTTGTALSKGSRGSYPAVSRPARQRDT